MKQEGKRIIKERIINRIKKISVIRDYLNPNQIKMAWSLQFFSIFLLFAALMTNLATENVFSQEEGTTTARQLQEGEGEESIGFVWDDESIRTRELLGETGSQSLYKVLVDPFEEAAQWFGSMPLEEGKITIKVRPGAPNALKQQANTSAKIPPRFRSESTGEYENQYYEPYTDEKKYVLGVRVDFFRRGYNRFAVLLHQPVQLKGIVRAFEVWVVGRQKSHELLVIVNDIYGRERIIPVGKLDFMGWKNLTVQVPSRIVQYDYNFSTERGLTVKGFLIRSNPLESKGSYFLYLDNFSAEVSRFWEEYQDQRDPLDNWE